MVILSLMIKEMSYFGYGGKLDILVEKYVILLWIIVSIVRFIVYLNCNLKLLI
jgi:hypothetical protein